MGRPSLEPVSTSKGKGSRNRPLAVRMQNFSVPAARCFLCMLLGNLPGQEAHSHFYIATQKPQTPPNMGTSLRMYRGHSVKLDALNRGRPGLLAQSEHRPHAQPPKPEIHPRTRSPLPDFAGLLLVDQSMGRFRQALELTAGDCHWRSPSAPQLAMGAV